MLQCHLIFYYTNKRKFCSKIKEKDKILKDENLELKEPTNNKILKGYINMNKLIAELEKKGFHKEALKVKKVMGEGWESLPEGWTEKSAKEYWNSLTGDRKHKITRCIKDMTGKIDNPGAFCGSLARLVGYKPSK